MSPGPIARWAVAGNLVVTVAAMYPTRMRPSLQPARTHTEPYPSAPRLARALAALARSEATGSLVVHGPQPARVVLVGGRVLAIEGMAQAPALGELLARGGVGRAAIESLASQCEDGFLGAAAVRAGLVGAGAITHALRVQLRRRFGELASRECVDATFVRESVEVGPHVEPVRVGDVVLCGVRDTSESLFTDEASLLARLGDEPLAMTALGSTLTADAPLWPDEAAACALLGRGIRATDLARQLRSVRALRLVAALRALDGVAPRAPRGEALALLVRKTTELRRASSSEALLGLKPGAKRDEARRALRQLAGHLHPDRMQGGAAGVMRASHDVMSALTDAAHDLGRRG